MASIILSLWLAVTPYGGCVDGSDCRTNEDCGGGVCEDATCVCEEDHDAGMARP